MKIQVRSSKSGALLFEGSARGHRLFLQVLHCSKNPPILRNLDLSMWNLRRANLAGIALIDSNLTKANLDESNLTGSDLSGTDFTGVLGRRISAASSNFDRCVFSRARFYNGDFDGCSMRGADLRNADFRRTSFRNVDLTDALLDNANFSEADVTGTVFPANHPVSGITPIGSDQPIRVNESVDDFIERFHREEDARAVERRDPYDDATRDLVERDGSVLSSDVDEDSILPEVRDELKSW